MGRILEGGSVSSGPVLNAVSRAPVSGFFGKGNWQIFTQSGSFTVPDGVTSVRARVFGAGGGGSQSAGGSGGGFAIKTIIAGLTPGRVVTVTIGASGTYNTAGGTSSFGAFVSATGGTAGGGAAGAGSGGDLNYTGGVGLSGRGGGGAANIFGNGGNGGASGTSGGGGAGSAGDAGGFGIFGNPVAVQISGAGSGSGGAPQGTPDEIFPDYFGAGCGGGGFVGSSGSGGPGQNGGGGGAGFGSGGPGGFPGGGGGGAQNTAGAHNGVGGPGLVIVEW